MVGNTTYVLYHTKDMLGTHQTPFSWRPFWYQDSLGHMTEYAPSSEMGLGHIYHKQHCLSKSTFHQQESQDMGQDFWVLLNHFLELFQQGINFEINSSWTEASSVTSVQLSTYSMTHGCVHKDSPHQCIKQKKGPTYHWNIYHVSCMLYSRLGTHAHQT